MEQSDRRLAHLRREIHLRHDRLGEADLLGRDPPIGLGHRPHDTEGGGKECRLHPLPVARREVLTGESPPAAAP